VLDCRTKDNFNLASIPFSVGYELTATVESTYVVSVANVVEKRVVS
jgi:hypothetical protein